MRRLLCTGSWRALATLTLVAAGVGSCGPHTPDPADPTRPPPRGQALANALQPAVTDIARAIAGAEPGGAPADVRIGLADFDDLTGATDTAAQSFRANMVQAMAQLGQRAGLIFLDDAARHPYVLRTTIAPLAEAEDHWLVHLSLVRHGRSIWDQALTVPSPAAAP